MDNNNMFNQGQQNDFQNQQNYQQQPYQQPYQQSYQPMGDNLEEPVSFGEWMITYLIMMIPCVNIIMMFVWAFGNGKKSKSNYFKASLVWALIATVISIVIMIAFGAAFSTALNTSYYGL